MICHACGNKITLTNDDHSFNAPIKINGKLEPHPFILCNVHGVNCGVTYS